MVDNAVRNGTYAGTHTVIGAVALAAQTLCKHCGEGEMCPVCDRCVECCDCPKCDECGVLCEDAPGWCGNCGNCTTHCENTEACQEWSRNLEALAAGFYGFDSPEQLD